MGNIEKGFANFKMQCGACCGEPIDEATTSIVVEGDAAGRLSSRGSIRKNSEARYSYGGKGPIGDNQSTKSKSTRLGL